jgi:hypothetical protein
MTLQRVLLIAALVFFAVAALIGYTVLDWEYYGGWLALAAGCAVASRLP